MYAQLPLFQLPLFPLNTVLCPGGALPLRIFEQRYLDLIAGVLKAGSPDAPAFGVCLIRSGDEVGAVAQPHTVGTLAHIAAVDMTQPGILNVVVRGGRRFRIVETDVRPDRLLIGRVHVENEEQHVALPSMYQPLKHLLQRILPPTGQSDKSTPEPWEDAVCTGYRLIEHLPLEVVDKQQLLEINNPLERLDRLAQYIKRCGRARRL